MKIKEIKALPLGTKLLHQDGSIYKLESYPERHTNVDGIITWYLEAFQIDQPLNMLGGGSCEAQEFVQALTDSQVNVLQSIPYYFKLVNKLQNLKLGGST